MADIADSPGLWWGLSATGGLCGGFLLFGVTEWEGTMDWYTGGAAIFCFVWALGCAVLAVMAHANSGPFRSSPTSGQPKLIVPKRPEDDFAWRFRYGRTVRDPAVADAYKRRNQRPPTVDTESSFWSENEADAVRRALRIVSGLEPTEQPGEQKD